MGLREDIDRSFRRLIREGVDDISDKEARIGFNDMDDQDLDNDGDTDESDEYLYTRQSKVAKVTEEEELDEMSTTAGVPGYQTPYAFGDADEDTYGQGGMKRVKKTNRIFKPMESKSTFKKMMSEMYGMKSSTNEAVSYRDYKKDPTSTPQQKVNKGIAEVNAMLSEMEKIVANNLRLKTEMGVQSNHFWKSTGSRFAKINERMTRIANKLKELSQ
jgi:hypothetical protein